MGRSAVYLVMGFSLISLYFGTQSMSQQYEAMDNAWRYEEFERMYSLGNAGANLVGTGFFFDSTYPMLNGLTSINNIPFNGGTFSILPVVNELNDEGLTLKTIRISTEFLSSDLNVGSKTLDDTVIIKLKPRSFAQFAYYSSSDDNGVRWVTGDTVFGPFHSNTYVYCYTDNSIDRPTFMDKVTSKSGVYPSFGARPRFLKGHFKPVDIPMPAYTNTFNNLKKVAKEDGHYELAGVRDSAGAPLSWYKYADWANHVLPDATHDTVWLAFRANGTVTRRIRMVGSPDQDSVQVNDTLVTDYAPNGVICFEGFVVRVWGVITQPVSVVSMRNETTLTGGEIFLDSSTIYADTTYYSTDMLGLIASEKIWITHNLNNNSFNPLLDADPANPMGFDIHAVMFSLRSGFAAEDHGSRDFNGQIRLFGGICQYKRQAVGTTAPTGFKKSYHYDPRLMKRSPPGFPGTGKYEVLSWYE